MGPAPAARTRRRTWCGWARLGGLDPEAREQVAHRRHLEPGAGRGRCLLVAAREPPPAAELGEGLLDVGERPERDEAAHPRRCVTSSAAWVTTARCRCSSSTPATTRSRWVPGWRTLGRRSWSASALTGSSTPIPPRRPPAPSALAEPPVDGHTLASAAHLGRLPRPRSVRPWCRARGGADGLPGDLPGEMAGHVVGPAEPPGTQGRPMLSADGGS